MTRRETGTVTTIDLENAALWASLPDEAQSHAWRLMISKKPYEALRVLGQATGSNRKARALVAWLAEIMIKEGT
jgi:hypothetical protein